MFIPSNISISLCMIVKNEQLTIERALNSMKDIVDEMIIVDTGSTDRTKEIVGNYTDKIFDFEWIDDFSAARNYAFDQATMNYIMWLDADDVLLKEDANKLLHLKQTLDPSVDSVTMVYNLAFDENGKPTVSLRRNRLVKRSRHFRWYGAVHEYLDVSGNIINSDIAVTHKKERSDTTDRNLRIYQKLLEKGEEFSPRDLYYYANELKDHRMYDQAVEYYLKFLDTHEGWIEDEIAACGKLAELYEQLGDKEKALLYTLKSFEFDTPRAEFCCRLGYHFLEKKEYKKSIYWYELATQIPRPHESWGKYNEAYSTWVPHLQLCVCYDRLGEHERACRHNEIAGSYQPNHPGVLYNKNYFDSILKKTKTEE